MQLLDELFACEERSGVNPKQRTNRFVRTKFWSVNEIYMREIFSYPIPFSKSKIAKYRYKIPSLNKMAALGLIKNYLLNKNKHQLFSCTADVIMYRDGGQKLRAFYITNDSRPYTLKIVRDSERHKWIEAHKREVPLREQLASLKTINIPKIFSAEQWKLTFQFSEEMIFGRSFDAHADRKLYPTKLLPQLRDTYQAYGVRYGPIQTLLPSDFSDNVIALVGKKTGGRHFVQALQNVLERNGLAAVSLCHGGLAPGNIAVANGEVFFLDWKRASEGLIIFDLLRTALIFPKLSYMIEDIRDIMTPNFLGNSYRFEDILTIGIARGILRTPRGISKLLRVWRRHALSPSG